MPNVLTIALVISLWLIFIYLPVAFMIVIKRLNALSYNNFSKDMNRSVFNEWKQIKKKALQIYICTCICSLVISCIFFTHLYHADITYITILIVVFILGSIISSYYAMLALYYRKQSKPSDRCPAKTRTIINIILPIAILIYIVSDLNSSKGHLLSIKQNIILGVVCLWLYILGHTIGYCIGKVSEMIGERYVHKTCINPTQLEPAKIDMAYGEQSEVEQIHNTDFENRILCIDGSCIGVVSADGICNVCGKTNPNHKS